MSWWATVLGSLVGGRGFLTRLVDWGDNAGRRKFLGKIVETHGPEGALTVAQAMAIAEGRLDIRDLDSPSAAPPIQATAEREQPKAIESAGPIPPDNSAEPPP